jgi:hypothetical protein
MFKNKTTCILTNCSLLINKGKCMWWDSGREVLVDLCQLWRGAGGVAGGGIPQAWDPNVCSTVGDAVPAGSLPLQLDPQSDVRGRGEGGLRWWARRHPVLGQMKDKLTSWRMPTQAQGDSLTLVMVPEFGREGEWGQHHHGCKSHGNLIQKMEPLGECRA